MLNDTQKNALIAELQKPDYDGLSLEAAFDLLHKPQEITSTTSIPKPLSLTGILGGISQETAAKLAINPNVCDLRDKILANDRVGVGLWVQLFAIAGIVTVDEATMINSALVESEDITTTTITNPRIGKAFPGISGMPNSFTNDDGSISNDFIEAYNIVNA